MLQKLEGVLGSSKFRKDSFLRARPSKCHEDSVDIDSQIRIDYSRIPQWKHGQLCWEAKGPIAALYRDLGPKLDFERLQSKRESSREVSISLFMVGKTIARAKPIIIISGGDKQSREEAKSNIIRSNLLVNSDFEIGVLRHPPSGPIKPVAMDDQPTSRLPSSLTTFTEVYFDPKDEWRSTAMPIYIKTSETSVRKATGNAVYNGNTYGYVTAAHAFREPIPSDTTLDDDNDDDDLGMPFDSDSESESGDDPDDDDEDGGSLSDHAARRSIIQAGYSDSHMSDGHMEVGTRPPSHEGFWTAPAGRLNSNAPLHNPSSTPLSGLQLLGSLSSSMTSLDCAVVTVTNSEVALHLAALQSVSDERRSPICTAVPRQSHVVAWTSHGPVHGKVTDLPILMQVPGSTSYEHAYRFTYDGEIKTGDCGTFVTNEETKELYGFVIGKSERGCTAYMMAAEKSVYVIEKSGDWRYLDMINSELAVECERPSLDRERSKSPSKSSPAPYNKSAFTLTGLSMSRVEPKPLLSVLRDRHSINSASGAVAPEVRIVSDRHESCGPNSADELTLNDSAYNVQHRLEGAVRTIPTLQNEGAVDLQCYTEQHKFHFPYRVLQDDKPFSERIQHDTLKRRLGSSQISMIAIGAVIGVGLLIRSGNILRLGRPLPLVMSFPLLGVLAACVTMSIAEMISIRPLSGVLIRSTTRDLSVFVTEYIDPDLGSTVAVAYWFTYAWSFAAFLAVMSALMQYWELPSGIYEGTLYLLVPAILVVYNRSDIRLYGMIEVIGGTMKLCLLVLLMIAMIQGAGADLKTKTLHCPEKITGSDLDAANGWTQAFLMSLSIAAFAYIGVETIAMSTEETCAKAKRRYPPSSTVKFLKSFPACISILPGIMYFLAGVLVSLNGSWDDPRLPRMSWVTDSDGDMKSTASAFVLAVEESKIPGLASTLNLFLIFIVLDYANTSLYVASRSLFNLAVSLNGRPGQPWYVRLLSYFGRTNKSQVPSRALVASCIFVCVPILLSANGRGRDINAGIILDVFSTLGSTGIIIIWASQCWAYIRLSSCIENNREELHDMPFIQHWNGGKTSNFPHRIQRRPITAYVSLGACLFILVVANSASQWQDFNLQPLLSAYLPLICFTSLYVFIKVMRKSRWQLVDISSGGDLASKLFWLHEEE